MQPGVHGLAWTSFPPRSCCLSKNVWILLYVQMSESCVLWVLCHTEVSKLFLRIRLLTYFLVSFLISRSSSSFSFCTKLSKTGISNLIYWATWKGKTFKHREYRCRFCILIYYAQGTQMNVPLYRRLDFLKLLIHDTTWLHVGLFSDATIFFLSKQFVPGKRKKKSILPSTWRNME